jgi:cell division protein FtsW
MADLQRRRPATRAMLRPVVKPSDAETSRKHRPDYWLIALVLGLLVIGLIVLFSISPALSAIGHVSSNYYVNRQLLAIGLGIIVLVITTQLPLGTWRQIAMPLLMLAGAATLLAIVMPVNPNYPAHRWVRLGGLSFQSVELLKFALLVWLAGLLQDRVRSGTIVNLQETLKPILIALAVVGVVVVGIQSDLGSMGVIIAMVTAMLFVAGLPLKRLAIIAGIVLIGLVLAVSVIPYRRDRLMAFLHPSSNCQDSGYQACQALIAVGSGGMAGLGLGSGVQAYGYLPEASNDSIFAIYAEKFGFIGAVCLLAIFVALFARMKNIAERSPDDFSRLLVVGVLCWVSIQTMINVGAMIGVLPLKGITLPLVSYGGTSVIFVMAAIGLVFQASRHTVLGMRLNIKKGASNDHHPDGRRVGGAYHPNPGSR